MFSISLITSETYKAFLIINFIKIYIIIAAEDSKKIKYDSMTAIQIVAIISFFFIFVIDSSKANKI